MRIWLLVFSILSPLIAFANSPEEIIKHALAQVQVYEMKLSPVPYSTALQLLVRTDDGLKTFIVAREDMPAVIRIIDQVQVPLQASKRIEPHFSASLRGIKQAPVPATPPAHANGWMNATVTAANQQASK